MVVLDFRHVTPFQNGTAAQSTVVKNRGQILDFLPRPTPVKIIREVVGEMSNKSVFPAATVLSLWKTLLIVRQGRETEMRIREL